MKNFYRIILCILLICGIVSLFGCSAGKNDNVVIIGGADAPADIIVSSSDNDTTENLQTTVGNLGKSISYSLSEDEARAVAEKIIDEEKEYGIPAENFEYQTINILSPDEGYIAFNRGYGNTSETENFTNHAYYAVDYKNTAELCDFAYICIDAVTGDVLFCGYMGD